MKSTFWLSLWKGNFGNDHPVQPAATTPTGTVIFVESDEGNDAAAKPAAGAASALSTSRKKEVNNLLEKKTGGNSVCCGNGDSDSEDSSEEEMDPRSQRYRQVNICVRDWVLEKRRNRQTVSRRWIRLHAKKAAKEIPECAGFPSSLG